VNRSSSWAIAFAAGLSLFGCESVPDLTFAHEAGADATTGSEDATVADDAGGLLDATTPPADAAKDSAAVDASRDSVAPKDARADAAPAADAGCDAAMCCGSFPCSGTCDQTNCDRCIRNCAAGEQCCGKASGNSVCRPANGTCN
jgi:hypothetical protein